MTRAHLPLDAFVAFSPALSRFCIRQALMYCALCIAVSALLAHT